MAPAHIHENLPVQHPRDFAGRIMRVGDLNMHVVVEGPEDGPLMVLLHGFPEFWYGWRHQIRALAAAGYRVAVPDQRGYNLTDKTGPYSVFTLANDVRYLVHAFGRGHATIVGHDWGAVVAWLTAAFFPELVDRLIVMNAPHPMAYIRVLQSLYLSQLRKSIYILFFQIPFIPEWLLSLNNYEALAATMRGMVPRGHISEAEIDHYRAACRQPGAFTAALNWYRDIATRSLTPLSIRETMVRVPTCIIWGEPDPALDIRVARESRELCTDSELHQLPNAGHFVQHAQPDEVTRLVLEFAGRGAEK